MLNIILCVLLITGGCYSQLTDDDFKTPADIHKHFSDVQSGMLSLIANFESFQKYHATVNKTSDELKEMRKQYKALIGRLVALEADNKKKERKIFKLEDHVKVLESNIEYVQDTFAAHLKGTEERVNKTFKKLIARMERKDRTIEMLTRKVNGERKKVGKLSHKLSDLKAVVKNINKNMTSSFQALQTNSKWLTDYVRNKSEQDIGVHVEINRIQLNVQKLQEDVHRIEKVMSTPKTTPSMKTIKSPKIDDSDSDANDDEDGEATTPPSYVIHRKDTSARVTNKLENYENYEGQDMNDFQQYENLFDLNKA